MKIKLIGMQSQDVTGSSVLIEFKNGKKVLIDCGLYQSNNILRDHLTNNANFNFKTSEIDYVILSHQHCDHSARIPLLYKRGYKGKIGIVKDSRNVMKRMLEDCCYILDKTAKTLSKGKKQFSPIYEMEHVEETMSHVEEYDFFDEVIIDKGISFKFIPAQHISKSAQIVIHEGKDKFVYTGDLGNLNKPCLYTEQFEQINNCTIMVCESTYGERNRIDDTITREQEINRLKAIIEQTNGVVLIPSFSLQRTQEMLYVLKDMKYDIYVDSPLSCDITNEFNRLYDMQDILQRANIHLIEKWEDSLAIMSNGSKKIVLSSAGMLNAGRSVEWANRIVSDCHNSIVFVGYCSLGTIGRKLQERPTCVEIEKGKPIEIKCNIETLKSFSSHMQRQDLLNYLSSANCQKIILHHGSKQAKIDLKEDLDKLLYEKCKSTKVIIAEKGLEIEI